MAMFQFELNLDNEKIPKILHFLGQCHEIFFLIILKFFNSIWPTDPQQSLEKNDDFLQAFCDSALSRTQKKLSPQRDKKVMT